MTLDVFITDKGSKIKYRKRCELCKFADIDLLTDNLICSKNQFEEVEDDYLCNEFKLDAQIKQDIIDKCMKAI